MKSKGAKSYEGIIHLEYLNTGPLSLSLNMSLDHLSCSVSPVLSQHFKTHRNAKNKTVIMDTLAAHRKGRV